jgi:hypothetical protein
MQRCSVLCVCLLSLAVPARAQNHPGEAKVPGQEVELNSGASLPTADDSVQPVSAGLDVLPPGPINRPVPEKPQPIAREGDWIDHKSAWPRIPNDLVVVARKDDGKWAWHVERLNSCVDCGVPMDFKEAMFDKKASAMWGARAALMATDIELMYHLPCFEAGTCRNLNPVLGHNRVQSYAVGEGLVAASWILTAQLRKGSVKYRVGSYRHWWIFPLIGDATSAAGMILDLAYWHSR